MGVVSLRGRDMRERMERLRRNRKGRESGSHLIDKKWGGRNKLGSPMGGAYTS